MVHSCSVALEQSNYHKLDSSQLIDTMTTYFLFVHRACTSGRLASWDLLQEALDFAQWVRLLVQLQWYRSSSCSWSALCVSWWSSSAACFARSQSASVSPQLGLFFSDWAFKGCCVACYQEHLDLILSVRRLRREVTFLMQHSRQVCVTNRHIYSWPMSS